MGFRKISLLLGKDKVCFFLVLFLAVFCSQITWAQNKVYSPVNRHASPEARSLLSFLYHIQGKYMLSGQHNYPHELTRSSDSTYAITGKHAAIWGSDFIDPHFRQAIVEEAIRQYKRGSIITLMYHIVKPFDPDSLGFAKGVEGKITEEQWKEIITPGTEYYKDFIQKIDAVAVYLLELKKAHVPVLWRPFHEMNGGWFWWGNKRGKDGFRKLWLIMYKRYTKHFRLNNLIWVWSPNSPRPTPGDEADAYKNYFPGLKYVDVLAADIYHNDFRKSNQDQLLALAHGKPVAMGEVGEVPTPEIIKQQPYWCWFLIWAHFNWVNNSHSAMQALFNDPHVISRGELLKMWKHPSIK